MGMLANTDSFYFMSVKQLCVFCYYRADTQIQQHTVKNTGMLFLAF